MKTKLNLTQTITDLDGNPVPPNTTTGKLLATTLAAAPKANALKFWSWALALHKGEVVEVDEADYDTLYKFVETHEGLTVLARAQILQAMRSSQATP